MVLPANENARSDDVGCISRFSRFGRQAVSMAGPMVWNMLPDHLRDPSLIRSASNLFDRH